MDYLGFSVYLTIGALSLVYWLFKVRFNYWKSRGVPALEPTIPFGNFAWGNVHLTSTLANVYKQLKRQNPFVGVYFFIRPIALITDLDLVRNVLIKDFQYFTDRGTYYNEKDDPLSAHLFNLDGDKWKTLRAKLSPTFTSGKMKFMFSTVVDVAKEFRSTLSELIKKEHEIEMKELLARFTTDIIGSCAFGIECNSLKDPNAEFRLAGKKVFEQPRVGKVGRQFRLQFRELARMLHFKAVHDDVSKFFMGVVRETVALREKNNIKRNDFMDLLIDLKNKQSEFGQLTLEEIAAQAFVFFLAGFETSSTTMLFSLYELALNQDLQDRARQEIETVLEKHGGHFTYEAMMDMTFIDQIISESLRKYPPVTMLTRRCVKDYPVPNTKQIIENGTTVFIPAFEIQNDPDIFKDPETFDPDRFSSENVKEMHSLAFLGFGDGPRNCIGLRFGRMQSRVGLVMLLKYYRFSLGEDAPVPMVFSKQSFVLSPEATLNFKIEKVADF